MKRVIVVGATSGIGKEIAKRYIQRGFMVGVAGRRIELLEELKHLSPNNVFTQKIDITSNEATNDLTELINKLDGVDLFILSSGVGSQNKNLDIDIELNTVNTNALGFVRMIATIFNYYKDNKIRGGHIVAISSVAGTKGIGIASSYSATKSFNHSYLTALRQLSTLSDLEIDITDIRPGFVDTDLLKNRKYPMLMSVEYVVDRIVKAIDNRSRVSIVDWRYGLLVGLWRLIPNFLWEKMKVK